MADRLLFEQSEALDRLQYREEQLVHGAPDNDPAKGPYSNPWVTAAVLSSTVVFALGLIIVLLGGFVIIKLGTGDVALADRQFLTTCNVCQTLRGDKGGKGDKGDKGDKGENGINGKDARDGTNGSNGTNGICVPNPLFPCAKGDQGEKGEQGERGPTGTGIKGDKGDRGSDGRNGTDGVNGTNGLNGYNGTDGAIGPAGPPCGDNATFANVNVTGNWTCTVPLPLECLGPGGCMDFSLCELQAEGLKVYGQTIAPYVKIGEYGSPKTASLQVGDVGSASHYVRLGKRSGLNAYMMNTLETYSYTALLEANQFFTIRSVVNMDLITETGLLTITSETGPLQIKSFQDMFIDQSGSTGGMYFSSTSNINMTAPAWTTFSDFYLLTGSTNKWLSSNPYYTYRCCTQYDVTDTMNITMTITNDDALFQDNSTHSQYVWTDLVMKTSASEPSRDVRIIANNTQRTVSVMPNLNVPGYIINEGELDLAGCGAQWTGSVFVNDTLVVNGNTLIKGTLTQSGMSMACPSDERFKKNKKIANPKQCLKRMNALRIHSFTYDDDVVRQSGGKLKKDATYYGVMAQQIEEDFGYLVQKSEQHVNGMIVKDFLTLHPELMYGEIAGAIQQLTKLHHAMQEKFEALERMTTKMHRTLRKIKKARKAQRKRL